MGKTRSSAQQPSKQALAFRDKLTGKGQTTDALTKKLQALHAELADMEQETVDTNSLGGVTKELLSNSLMLHKDRGVKAYTAACLADILRLYAPDAPFTPAQIRDMFQFFMRQLTTGLKSPESTYYDQYFHLLESLSNVKSVVLVCDLPNADEITYEMFRDCFTLVRRDFSPRIQEFLGEILVALVDECQTLPSDALEILMAQFMDKNARRDQPAYRLAVYVLSKSVDKMYRHVSVYFTDTVVAHSEREEYDEIRAAHDLIKRLYSSCSALLGAVIPQLEEEMHADEVQIRIIATQALGDMFSSQGGTDLAKKFNSTWNIWLQRRNDKHQQVRLKFVEAARGLLVNAPDLRETIEEALRSKLLDPEEKVRAAVCKAYGQVGYETALHHVSVDQLHALASRAADRKPHVRFEALNSLGKLYSLAYPEIESNDPAAIEHFAWIPSDLFQLYINVTDVRPDIQHVVSEHILPLPLAKGTEIDEAAWTERLLTTVRHFDEKRMDVIIALANLKPGRPTIYEHFIDACVQNNGGVIDEDEARVTQRLQQSMKLLASSFPDPEKAITDLEAFAKLNDGRLYKLLRNCMDLQVDVKTLVKSTADFTKRLDQNLPSAKATMEVFLRRATLNIINQSSVPTLLSYVAKMHGTTISHANLAGKSAATILHHVSKLCPGIYKAHVNALVNALSEEVNETSVRVSLQALAVIAKWDNSVVPSDQTLMDQMRLRALGSDRRQAKFAARFLAFCNDKQVACPDLAKSIVQRLPKADHKHLAAHTAVLAQLARFAPDAFESQSEAIIDFMVKKLLMKPIPRESMAVEGEEEEEWAEEEEVSDLLRAKVTALKICRYRSLVHSDDKSMTVAKPVFKMFATILDNNGSYSPEADEDPKVLSRMRLQAALSLLQLSTVEHYASALSSRFLRLALVVQDSCFNVRFTFLTKLVNMLLARKLDGRFNVIPFLTVHDPEEDAKHISTSYVTTAVKRMPPPARLQNLELLFIRFLHLLSHHPDFTSAPDDLTDTAQYIKYYVQLVATQENISLLYHLAMKGKTARDGDPQSTSENFYMVCELAQEILKMLAHHRDWNITTYPQKIKLPSDILRPLPNPEASTKIVRTVYLPEETRTWVTSIFGVKGKKNKPVKRKAASATNGHSKKKPRTKKRQADDGEDDEEVDDDATVGDATDAEMRSSSPPPAEDEQEEEEEESGEEQLGRGARGRAKARAKRQAKQKKKDADSDG